MLLALATVGAALPAVPAGADEATAALARCVEAAQAAEAPLPEISHPDVHLDNARLRAIFDAYSECARDWGRARRGERKPSDEGS